jgi:hypothetical protein
MTWLRQRRENPNAHTSIALDVIAAAANPFLKRAAEIRGEEFIPYDVDDVVGICINLIDQVLNTLLLVGLCVGVLLFVFVGVGVGVHGRVWVRLWDRG